MGRDAVVVDHRDVQAREVLRLESDGVLVVLAPPGVVRLHALQPGTGTAAVLSPR